MTPVRRNRFVTAFLAVCILFGLSESVRAEGNEQPRDDEITVYKSPTCGCCGGWVEYLEDNGFHVTTHELTDLSGIRSELGMTDPRLLSCHTAVVGGYLVEGHVPADDIRRLLSEQPPIAGISAPGMPPLSPGMNSIEPKDYDVLSFDAQGRVELFSRY